MEFETEKLDPDLAIGYRMNGVILWRYEGSNREIRHLRYFRDCRLTMEYQETSYKDEKIPYRFDLVLNTTDIFGSTIELDLFRRSVSLDGKNAGKAGAWQLFYENGQLVISGVIKMRAVVNYSEKDSLLFQGMFIVPQADAKDFKIRLLNMRNKMRIFEDRIRVV